MNNPVDLKKGDSVIFVTWNPCKATPPKVEKVSVDMVCADRFAQAALYGVVNIPARPKKNPALNKWIFQRRGAWDFNNIKWGDELIFHGRLKQAIFHLDQLKEAQLFADTEVPQKQLATVMERIDKLKQNFTNKIDEMETLQKILAEKCNTTSGQSV